MPRDFPFPGAKIVFIDNPEDVHNLLAEIFGEKIATSIEKGDLPFPRGMNPPESKADFPIGKDDLDDVCAECPIRDCPDRTAAYEGADDEETCYLLLDGPKVPKDHISTPKFKVSFPFMEKPAEPKGEKYKVDLDLGKTFEPLKERIEATLADIRKAEKKRKDTELDDLATRLFKKMSHQFYRDRAFRLSRIDELLGQVDKLTAELRNKEKVIGFYEEAVKNTGSIDWNKTADRKAGHLVYVTDDEFETLKALEAGTAKVVPADKPAEPEWFDFIDPETSKLVLPMQYVTVEVSDPRVNGGRVQTLVRVFEAEGVRFTSPNGIATPFGFDQAKWRYKAPGNQPPVPDDIPLNNLV